MNVGGPAKHITQLTAGLDSERFEQIVVAGLEPAYEASYLPEARRLGVEPLIVPELGRALSTRGDAVALLKLYRHFRAWRPDIVETHTAKAGTLGRLAAALARVPVRVHVFHGHVFHGYFSPAKTRFFLQVERALARVTTRIIALGHEQRRDLLTYGIGAPGQVVSIPLGFDLRPFTNGQAGGALRRELGVAADTPLAGIVGRIAPIKRLDVFLQAAAHVRTEVPGARFVIAGDGELRTQSERLAESLGLRDHVHFLGWRDDLVALYHDLDVVVLTSDNEGMPVSLIEAQASARPVVATDVGGVRSIVEHGTGGLLVPKGDARAVAGACVRLLLDPALRRRMGEAGRAAVVPRYSLANLIDTMSGFYTSLVERQPRRGRRVM